MTYSVSLPGARHRRQLSRPQLVPSASARQAVALLDHLAWPSGSQWPQTKSTEGFEARLLLADPAHRIGKGEGAEDDPRRPLMTPRAMTSARRDPPRRADNLFWRPRARRRSPCAVLERAARVRGCDRPCDDARHFPGCGLQLFGGATAGVSRDDRRSRWIGMSAGDVLAPLQALPRRRCGRAAGWPGLSARHSTPPPRTSGTGRGPSTSVVRSSFTPVFVSANRGAAPLIEGRLDEAESSAAEAFEEGLTPGRAMFRGFFGFWLGWARRGSVGRHGARP